jgi:hypothetical protein
MITQSKTTTATTIENRKKITLEDIQQNSTKKKNLGQPLNKDPGPSFRIISLNIRKGLLSGLRNK